MLHKLRTADAPRLSAPERIAPRIADDPEVRVVECVQIAAGLAFRAEGAAPAGVYLEATDGTRRMLAPDTEQHLMLGVRAAGEGVAVLAARQGSTPGRPDAVVFVPPSGEAPIGIPGQAFAVAARAPRAVVADLDAGALVQVDLHSGETGVAARLRFEAHEQPAPLLTLDDRGERALVMEVEGGRVHLVQIDLSTGEATPVIEGLPEPSWVLGAHLPGGALVVLEMAHDASSRFRLLRFDPGKPAHTLLTLDHGQPAVVPAILKPGWMALVLSLEAHRFTEYGPTDLVAVPVGGGARVQLTKQGDLRGRPRAVEGGLLLEGGAALQRFRLR